MLQTCGYIYARAGAKVGLACLPCPALPCRTCGVLRLALEFPSASPCADMVAARCSTLSIHSPVWSLGRLCLRRSWAAHSRRWASAGRGRRSAGAAHALTPQANSAVRCCCCAVLCCCCMLQTIQSDQCCTNGSPPQSSLCSAAWGMAPRPRMALCRAPSACRWEAMLCRRAATDMLLPQCVRGDQSAAERQAR